MSEFFIGQQVVCIDAGEHDRYRSGKGVVWGDLDGLLECQIYTISQMPDEYGHGITLVLKELVRPRRAVRFSYKGYAPERFRPLESKAISLFRKIALDITEGKKVRIDA